MGVKFASSSFLDFVANIFGVDIGKKSLGQVIVMLLSLETCSKVKRAQKTLCNK